MLAYELNVFMTFWALNYLKLDVELENYEKKVDKYAGYNTF
jgi:peroxiredoxin family protein